MKILSKPMIVEDILFRMELRKLQAEEQAVVDSFDPEIQKARSNKNWEQENIIASQMFFEKDNVRSEIWNLQHRYITRQADRLLLPIPKFDMASTDWRHSEFDGKWTLSSEALARLGREVRQERRERLELAFLWPSAMIGLIGGLVGVLSAFWK